MVRAEEVIKAMGCDFEAIDIAGMTEGTVRQKLAGKDLIYVTGGNTFYLLEQMRKSGFDKIIRELIDAGVPYIGASAGAYVMCPSIEVTWFTNPERNYMNLEDLSGLNYVPFIILAHYMNLEKRSPEEWDEIVQKIKEKAKYPLEILRDGQGFLIEGDNISFVDG